MNEFIRVISQMRGLRFMGARGRKPKRAAQVADANPSEACVQRRVGGKLSLHWLSGCPQDLAKPHGAICSWEPRELAVPL